MAIPVDIPTGGMMIFFGDTGVRPSCTRQNITAMAPATELTSESMCGIVIRALLKNETGDCRQKNYILFDFKVLDESSQKNSFLASVRLAKNLHV